MENKIISINVSPGTDEEINENGGVMWEHNATSLVFNIDPAYVGDYRYYIEYRSLIGTKIRTEYLELNDTNNTITYNVPVTMTSLRGVECYFNIVNINEDGQTVQVIKPKKFYLEFDYSPGTDDALAKEYDFSINALLEAIRTGSFYGSSTGGSNGGSGGLNSTARNLLIEILEKAIFSTNVSGKIEQLQEALASGGSDAGDSNTGGSDTGGGNTGSDTGGNDTGGGNTGGNTGGGNTTADDITVENGIMTIISVGSEISVTNGIMTIL